MRIPYGELQTVNVIANDENGHEHVLERVCYAFVIPCRDCKYNDEVINACEHPCITPLRGDCPENWIFSTVPEGFCAWGKRIVRCKDCVSSYRDRDGMWCCFYGTGFYRKPTDEGNYCSKGKRRD